MNMMRHGKHEFLKEVMAQLNMTAEQVAEIEKLKKIGKKEKLSLMVKYMIGRAKPHDFMEIILPKIEKAEAVLTTEQNMQLREILMAKHKKMFMHMLMSKMPEIKEMLEELELSEEQKNRVEELFAQVEELDCMKIKEEMENILTEEQHEKAKAYIMTLMYVDKIFEELEVSQTQKEQLKELHKKVKNDKMNLMEEFKAGKISFSELAKEKFGMFNELENIFSKEQIKKFHKLHKNMGGCHRHKHCCI